MVSIEHGQRGRRPRGATVPRSSSRDTHNRHTQQTQTQREVVCVQRTRQRDKAETERQQQETAGTHNMDFDINKNRLFMILAKPNLFPPKRNPRS
eukprot:scaffold143_cov173-Ochromonas_danica.AAC.25